MLQRLALAVLFAVAAAGCGLGVVDPGDAVVLPDDDESADDDDATGDPTDDDDASDDDDDDDTVDAPRRGIVWLLDRADLLPSDSSNRLFAAASFDSDGDLEFADFDAYLGLPLPGLLLHPALDPGFEDGEGCVAIASTDDRDPLPDSEDVGDHVGLSGGGGEELVVELLDGVYRLEADGPAVADTWSLAIPGGATWPGSETEDVLLGPPAPTGILPTPGVLGSLTSVHVGWSAEDSAGVEIVLVRFASQVDTDTWQGFRCLAVDDGTFTVDATPLAAAGSGDVHIFVSRARWTFLEAVPSEGRPALEAGFVRAASFQMTVGG